MSTRELSKALKAVREARRAANAAYAKRWKLYTELEGAKRAEETANAKCTEARRALEAAISRVTDPAPHKSS